MVKGASVVVGLLAVPAYMRYFDDPAALGTWYTMQTCLQWVLMFDLGVGNGLRNRLVGLLVEGDGDKVSLAVSSAYRLLGVVCLALGAVVAVVGAAVPWNAAFNVPNEVLSPDSLRASMVIVLCGVVLQLFLQLINGILYALQLSSVVNALSLASNTLILVFISVAPVRGDDQCLVFLATVNVVSMALPLLVASAVVFGRGLLGCSVNFRKFSWTLARESLSTGLVILFLQLAWAVVATTHSLLISLFRDPSEVVEFQVYYKVYYTLGSLAAIALVPVWSAVTMAQAQGRFRWIEMAYRKCLLLSVAVALVCLATAPFVQAGFDIWLGDESIAVDMRYVAVMSAFSVVFVLQNVNSSIGNGLSFFRIQVVCMGIGAAAMVPLAYLLCGITESWIGVVVATIVAIAPFQLIEPVACMRYIKKREERQAG